MATLFSRIISGDLSCYKVAENSKYLAFLDIAPLAKGHVLVIPKTEVDYFFDIEDSDLSDFILFAKLVAQKMRKVIPCKKIGLTVIGLEVPHAHIHLIPIDGIQDMDFSKPKLKFTSDEFSQIARLIAEA
jgi:histidine triad (HIT) family protein